MLPEGQGQIRFMTPQRRQEFENFLKFGQIQDCYVKKFLPPDNMRQALIVEDFASVNQQ